jgi:hypothetical protein
MTAGPPEAAMRGNQIEVGERVEIHADVPFSRRCVAIMPPSRLK